MNKAAALREAGYTLATIAQRVDVSPRTRQRHFKTHQVSAGALKTELIDKARQDLLDSVTASEGLKREAARLLADDVASARLIRDKAAQVAEVLSLDDHQSATETARALAAISTTLKNTQDVLRRSLNIDKVNAEIERETLPEPVIREMTAEEVEEAQRQARERLSANTI
jgi:AraC-like DNA-binding protein